MWQVLQVGPCNAHPYFGNIVPKRMKERMRFDPSRSKETMLAAVRTFSVFFIPRMFSMVSKYLSPSNGNIGSMLTNATPRRISDINDRWLSRRNGPETGRED